MTDNDKLPDALDERPVETGSKDMGGYFCHWYVSKSGRTCDLWLTVTSNGERTAFIQSKGDKVEGLKTPAQTTVYFYYSLTGREGAPRTLYSSTDSRTIVQASNRIN